MLKFKEVLKPWLPALIVALIIFLASSQTGTTVNNTGFNNNTYQIGGHFFLYVLLCLSLFKATKNILLSMALAFLYGVIDEIHQTFVPGRSFQYSDILVDSMGILLTGLILWKKDLLLPNKLKNWLSK